MPKTRPNFGRIGQVLQADENGAQHGCGEHASASRKASFARPMRRGAQPSLGRSISSSPANITKKSLVRRISRCRADPNKVSTPRYPGPSRHGPQTVQPCSHAALLQDGRLKSESRRHRDSEGRKVKVVLLLLIDEGRMITGAKRLWVSWASKSLSS